MALFSVANLGDAAVTVPVATVTVTGGVATGGILLVNNTSGAAITLTLATAISGPLTIVDMSSTAATYPITLTVSGGIININKATTYVLDVPGQWATVIWNGTYYTVIG